MKKKKFLKYVKEAFDNSFVRFLACILLVALIFVIYVIAQGERLTIFTVSRKLFDILKSDETLSVLLAAIISICFARFLRIIDKNLEESYKITDDHHAIISKYSEHTKESVNCNGNLYNKAGVYMTLSNVDLTKSDKLKPDVKDRYSDKYKKLFSQIEDFKSHKLALPTVDVFTNLTGKTEIVFKDSNELFELPEFIIENAPALMDAHKNSKKRNQNTVRLNDFDYDSEHNVLTLDTMRTTYFHMLVSNRCMDYELHNDITVRSAYEYEKYVSKLEHSKLSNQIGVNGLVITNDGFVLVEKRDHHKTTWKNKFAQSISLSMKTADLGINDGVVGDTYGEANKRISRVIYSTLRKNFGLVEKDFVGFDLKENFLGIARDLLEGGKPNMYFYIKADMDGKTLAELLEKNAASTGDGSLDTEKLSNDYYLVHFSDIKIGFNYTMTVDRSRSFWPRRHIKPRSPMIQSVASASRRKLLKRIKPKFTRECGEALLVTLSYLYTCRERIPELDLMNPFEKN